MRRQSRRGMSLVEVLVTAALLGTIFTMALPSLAWVAVQRRQFEQRQVATAELQNQMERLMSLPAASLTPELAAAASLPESVVARLPDHQFRITLSDLPGPPAMKKIVLEIEPQRSNGRGAKVPAGVPWRLTAWRSLPAGGASE